MDDDGAYRARAGQSLKNQEFVLAARATGVSTARIIFRHLVPNTLGPVIVYATLTIPTVNVAGSVSFILVLACKPRSRRGQSGFDGIQNIAIFPGS